MDKTNIHNLTVIVRVLVLGQIILTLTAILGFLDTVGDTTGVEGPVLIATILGYFALLAIGLALAMTIVDDTRSMFYRVFAFVYYLALTLVLYISAADPGFFLIDLGLI